MYAAQEYVRELGGGRLLLDYGPLTLTILAQKEGNVLREAALLGAEEALRVFGQLVGQLDQAKRFLSKLRTEDDSGFCPVLRKMETAVKALDDPDFTPMAAVAGSFSEWIVERIREETTADYIVVNNGGDIAFYTPRQERFKIGVMSDICERSVETTLVIPKGSPVQGAATSGFGGRSLSRGIASAVTALAGRCSIADAAATAIANAAYTEHESIVTCLAEEVDYATDIRGLTVVRSVGHLDENTKGLALENALRKARQLTDKGMIAGCVIYVQGQRAHYPHISKAFSLSE